MNHKNLIAKNISSQEGKGARWMPWHMKTMKDVSERKLRLAHKKH